ncbi:MAG: 50S ribosomal protein L6 [Bacteroidota bacterium]
MSRVGRKPIPILPNVQVEKSDGEVKVIGPKGELTARMPQGVSLEIKEKELVVTRRSEEKRIRALHGLWRSLLNNMVLGVTKGYEKQLDLVGVGYKAEMKGKKLQLQVGYSHPILFAPPEEIKIQVSAPTNITITGIDKALVGLVAAKIRSLRPPEPYKGKGIRYKGEHVRRKAGKAAAVTGARA